jgi:hypothetical protein
VRAILAAVNEEGAWEEAAPTGPDSVTSPAVAAEQASCLSACLPSRSDRPVGLCCLNAIRFIRRSKLQVRPLLISSCIHRLITYVGFG